MDNAYPRMRSMERDQKHLRTFLFEAIQEVSSIHKTLNNAKLKSDSCLNHLKKKPLLLLNNIAKF